MLFRFHEIQKCHGSHFRGTVKNWPILWILNFQHHFCVLKWINMSRILPGSMGNDAPAEIAGVWTARAEYIMYVQGL